MKTRDGLAGLTILRPAGKRPYALAAAAGMLRSPKSGAVRRSQDSTDTQGAMTLPTGADLMDALMWTAQITFPEDFQRDLVERGATEDEAQLISFAYSTMKKRCLFALYMDYAYAVGDARWKTLIWSYIEARLQDWQTINARGQTKNY